MRSRCFGPIGQTVDRCPGGSALPAGKSLGWLGGYTLLAISALAGVVFVVREHVWYAAIVGLAYLPAVTLVLNKTIRPARPSNSPTQSLRRIGR